MENTLYLDLLKPEMFRLLSAKPKRLSEMILGDKKISTVIIHEIQKIPELLDQVHLLIEEHKKIQFVMIGSSARKLKRTGVNLLAGRAPVKTFHPFMAAELENRFDLEKALLQGLVPLVVDAAEPEHTLQSYAALYLREGVQTEGLVYPHLQAWIAYSENKCSLSYWRTRAGNEVDFIVYGPNEFYVIEVKNSARIRSEDYSSLKAFGEDYPKASRVILYRGKHRY